MTLGEWMRAQQPRKLQEEVALLLDVSQPTVSRIIAGKCTAEQAQAVFDLTGGEVDLRTNA